jgi:hypothetical protein
MLRPGGVTTVDPDTLEAIRLVAVRVSLEVVHDARVLKGQDAAKEELEKVIAVAMEGVHEQFKRALGLEE